MRQVIHVLLFATLGNSIAVNAQSKLTIQAIDSIVDFKATDPSGKFALAIVTRDWEGTKSWKVRKFRINGNMLQPVGDPPLIDGLSAIYDLHYDGQTNQATVIAEQDTAKDKNINKPALFLAGLNTTPDGPTAPFLTYVSSFFYPYFDEAGYTGCKDIAGQLSYIRYDNTIFNIDQEITLRGQGVDTLFPVNSLNIAVLHGSAGYFLYNLKSRTILTAPYANKPWAFKPDIFVVARDTVQVLLLFRNNAIDASKTYDHVNLIKGRTTCLEAYASAGAHEIITGIIPPFTIQTGDDTLLSIKAFPFHESLLVTLRNKQKDSCYTIDLRTGQSTAATVRPQPKKTVVTPFYPPFYFFELPDDHDLIIRGPRTSFSLGINPFHACYHIDYPYGHDLYYFLVTGTDSHLEVHLVQLDPTTETFTIKPLGTFAANRKISYAFKHNTLVIRDDGGWNFIDGFAACSPGTLIRYNRKTVMGLFYPRDAQDEPPVKYIYFFTDWPRREKRGVLVGQRIKEKEGEHIKYTFWEISYEHGKAKSIN